MKRNILIILILNVVFSMENTTVYHGLIIELTQNGAGIYYQPEIIKPVNIYTKLGLHFERSNTLEVDPYFNTQNPGFKKTIGLLVIGGRIPLLQNYFYNNMSFHLLGEIATGNNFSSFIKGELDSNNNRLVTGISLQIPSGKIMKRYDFCFQTNNIISGIFLVRFHFLKKLM